MAYSYFICYNICSSLKVLTVQVLDIFNSVMPQYFQSSIGVFCGLTCNGESGYKGNRINSSVFLTANIVYLRAAPKLPSLLPLFGQVSDTVALSKILKLLWYTVC